MPTHSTPPVRSAKIVSAVSPGWAQKHADGVLEDGCLAVQKVARLLDAGGDLGELLNDGARRERAVVASVTRGEQDAPPAGRQAGRRANRRG